MDLLLKHEGDKRYSLSVNGPNDENLTVSEVCQEIAFAKICCFKSELRLISFDQHSGVPRPINGQTLLEWWTANRQRGLPELQIEAIDESLRVMRGLDGRTARPWHVEASPLPLDEFNRRRDQNIETLKRIRQTIVISDEPYRPKSLVSWPQCIFGLPWTPRRVNL